jgi:hypothetical protein
VTHKRKPRKKAIENRFTECGSSHHREDQEFMDYCIAKTYWERLQLEMRRQKEGSAEKYIS